MTHAQRGHHSTHSQAAGEAHPSIPLHLPVTSIDKSVARRGGKVVLTSAHCVTWESCCRLYWHFAEIWCRAWSTWLFYLRVKREMLRPGAAVTKRLKGQKEWYKYLCNVLPHSSNDMNVNESEYVKCHFWKMFKHLHRFMSLKIQKYK